MKNLPTLPLLLSAVAVSAAPASGPAELKYDRLAVGYTSGSDTRSYSLTGTALVGGHILVGGSVSDYKVKALAVATGRGVTFDLGYKFTLSLVISSSAPVAANSMLRGNPAPTRSPCRPRKRPLA